MGAVSIGAVIGVFLAYVIQRLTSRSDRIEQRKQSASLLGYEVASIKAFAEKGISVHADVIKKYKLAIDIGAINTNSIADTDFPRSIYDKPSLDLALFDSTLAGKISELYRWIGVLHSKKVRANSLAGRLEVITSKSAAIGVDRLEPGEIDQAKFLAKQFVIVYEGYLDTMKRVARLASAAFTGLDAIKKIDDSVIEVEVSNLPDNPAVSTPKGAVL